MNAYITVISETFKSYEDYTIETYEHHSEGTVILHITVHKTNRIVYASDGVAYVRAGVQNLPCDNDEKIMQLRLDKSMISYEDEKTQTNLDDIKGSMVLANFLKAVAPTTTPYDWLRKYASNRLFPILVDIKS